jgi:LysM repeat protein
MLIEGCVSEHAKTSANPVAAVDEQTQAPPPIVAVAEPKPVLPQIPPPAHPAAPAVVVAPAAAATKVAPPAVDHPGIVYVVKAGDTLIRIARQHHTTTKAIKDMNGLGNDMISVGAKLKLPSV